MEAIRNALKQNTAMRIIVDTARLLKAVRVYNRTGATPLEGVHSARHLFFATNKRSHKMYTAVQNFVSRNNAVDLGTKKGVLGDMNDPLLLGSVVSDMTERGVHIFKHGLSKDLCDKLVEFAHTVPSKPRLPGGSEKIVYDTKNLKANLYDFAPQDMLQSQIVQELITDDSILTVARELLGPSVRLQNVSLWWSNANFHNVSKNAAAQLYHVDMDTIKWVKIFFYLTDVGPNNGPHCYIAKSHRTAPREVYREGRIEDEEIEAHFNPKDIIEITGPAGTAVIADTVGLHKGKALVEGERLMMQFTFAITHFGYDPPTKVQIDEKNVSSGFWSKIDKNPSVFRNGYF